MDLVKFKVKNYRSINDLSFTVHKGVPLVVCGSNNVGKTNILRSLDLFFNYSAAKYSYKIDFPFHVVYGSTSGQAKTTFTGVFEDGSDTYTILCHYFRKNDETQISFEGKRNRIKMTESECIRIIQEYKYFFIEASNVSIPKLIEEIVDNEVLKEGLHKRRTATALNAFSEFVKQTKKTLQNVENDILKNFMEFVDGVEGINVKGRKVSIKFEEIKKLKEAIADLVHITLFDQNDLIIDNKGSGIQRLFYTGLIKFISQSYSEKIIWGIDEPEAFLQPSLQKKMKNMLYDLAITNTVITTTHSQHFLDLQSMENVELAIIEHKEYKYKKKAKPVYQARTSFYSGSTIQKMQKIKEHFGISSNDGWSILPKNVLVEGHEDKQYLQSLFKYYGLEAPHIIDLGGATKVHGYLQYIKVFSQELTYKPHVRCIFDNDSTGRQEFEKVKGNIKKHSTHLEVTYEFIPRFDGMKDKSFENEIEDLIPIDILREGINIYLKKNGYEPLKKIDINTRASAAYNKLNVLKFLSQKIAEKNPSKEPIMLEDEGFKILLCKNVCEYINKNKSILSLDQNILIKDYLQTFIA